MFSSRYVEKNSNKRKDGLEGLIMVFRQETFKFQTEGSDKNHGDIIEILKAHTTNLSNRYPSYSQSTVLCKSKIRNVESRLS